jgi:hypothetical protein
VAHSQALWTSFLGGLPHLRRLYLSFGWTLANKQEVWRRNLVPHVLALLKAAEAAQRKLHVQMSTDAWCVCSDQATLQGCC